MSLEISALLRCCSAEPIHKPKQHQPHYLIAFLIRRGGLKSRFSGSPDDSSRGQTVRLDRQNPLPQPMVGSGWV